MANNTVSMSAFSGDDYIVLSRKSYDALQAEITSLRNMVKLDTSWRDSIEVTFDSATLYKIAAQMLKDRPDAELYDTLSVKNFYVSNTQFAVLKPSEEETKEAV